MISNVVATTSTGNATRYLLRREPGQAEIIGGTIAHTDPNAIAAEFHMSESMGNQQLRKAGYHISISYHPDDSPTNEQMATVAEKHFAGMVVSGENPNLLQPGREADYKAAVQDWLDNRAGDFQYLIVRHNDTNHEHAHLIASRVDMATGKAVERDYDRFRSQMIARQLEQEYGLTQQESSWEIDHQEDEPEPLREPELETTGTDQYLNEIDDIQLERLDRLEQLVQTIPDAKFGDFELKTTEKGRSLTEKNKPIVEWHQARGTSNYGIKELHLRALEKWQREIKERKRKERQQQQQQTHQQAAWKKRKKSRDKEMER